MNKKTIGIIALFASLVLIVNVSALQIRPMNQLAHPGLTSPYVPSAEGPNHVGVSDYTNTFTHSELCESDHQLRPANQGHNIPVFFSCQSE